MATPVDNFKKKRFLRERVYIVGLQSSFLQLWCLQLLKPDVARVFCLVSLGVTNYPWEIIGMDFVTDFTKSSEFHLTNIIVPCLPSEMAHFLSCHEKLPLIKPWLSLLIIDIDFMVFHKSLRLTDSPALLANLAIFYEEIEYQTHYECGKTSSNR